jgi:hypothetical protein
VDVLRERPAPELLDKLVVAADQGLQVGGVEVGVEVDALVLLGDLQRFLERAVIELEHDVRIHLDEAAVAVPGEAGVTETAARPCTVWSLRPRFSTVSIMPASTRARRSGTETSNGSAGVAEALAVAASICAMPVATSARMPSGKLSPLE